MKKHLEKIKKHVIKKQHHYKVILLFVVLLAIVFFAHTAGNGTYVTELAQNRCWSDKDCSAKQFCEFDICLSETGKCVDVPELCPTLWNPVCGCDGKNYPNDCARRVSKVSKEHNGVCV